LRNSVNIKRAVYTYIRDGKVAVMTAAKSAAVMTVAMHLSVALA